MARIEISKTTNYDRFARTENTILGIYLNNRKIEEFFSPSYDVPFKANISDIEDAYNDYRMCLEY